MLDSFRKYIDQNKLIKPGDKVLLAVSGGIDSVVMLDLFHKTRIPFAIAHCNFKLRGKESDGDEQFVRELAVYYKTEIYASSCDTADYAEKHKLSIQESARELRYAWFNTFCSEYGYTSVAIAHNQDDKVETFFINLFRGAGIKGLKSIPVKRQKIIRPLMFASRNQIVGYVRQNYLKYREDSSNSSDYYLRNKIRHNLIPKIEEISPGFSITAQKSIENLVDAELILQSAISEKKKLLFSIGPEDTIQLNKNGIRKLSPFNEWVYYLLSEYGFNKNITNDVCTSLNDENQIGKRFYSDRYELLIDRSFLLLREIKKTFSDSTYEISVNQNEVKEPLNIKIENCSNHKEFLFNDENNTAYFDFEKLTFPLIIRRWQHGDRMIPYGMKGNKLISDILINNKVCTFEKDNTFVIISGKKIVWLVGHRSSNDFKVSKSTRKITTMFLIK